jgi:hypothetical protein
MIERLLRIKDGRGVPVGYVASLLVAIILGVVFEGPWYQKFLFAFVVWWGGVLSALHYARKKEAEDD